MTYRHFSDKELDELMSELKNDASSDTRFHSDRRYDDIDDEDDEIFDEDERYDGDIDELNNGGEYLLFT